MSMVTSICVVLPMEVKIWKLQSDCIIPSFWLILFLSFQLHEDIKGNNIPSHSNNNGFPDRSSAFSFISVYITLWGHPAWESRCVAEPVQRLCFFILFNYLWNLYFYLPVYFCWWWCFFFTSEQLIVDTGVLLCVFMVFLNWWSAVHHEFAMCTTFFWESVWGSD